MFAFKGIRANFMHHLAALAFTTGRGIYPILPLRPQWLPSLTVSLSSEMVLLCMGWFTGCYIVDVLWSRIVDVEQTMDLYALHLTSVWCRSTIVRIAFSFTRWDSTAQADHSRSYPLKTLKTKRQLCKGRGREKVGVMSRTRGILLAVSLCLTICTHQFAWLLQTHKSEKRGFLGP